MLTLILAVCFLAVSPVDALRTQEPPDWQPLLETWKMKGGTHASDVVETYKALNPPPSKDFRKIRRYSKVLMSKLRREILQPQPDRAVAAVEQGTFRLMQLPSGQGSGVLYTVGLGPCIGMAMEATYPGGSAIALAHADSSTDVTAALSQMTHQLQTLGASNVSLTLVGGRMSAQGLIRAQFESIFQQLSSFQQKSEMCTLLSPDAVAGGVAGAIISTAPMPSLTSQPAGAVACAEELVDKVKEGGKVEDLGGKLSTFQLPTVG